MYMQLEQCPGIQYIRGFLITGTSLYIAVTVHVYMCCLKPVVDLVLEHVSNSLESHTD